MVASEISNLLDLHRRVSDRLYLKEVDGRCLRTSRDRRRKDEPSWTQDRYYLD